MGAVRKGSKELVLQRGGRQVGLDIDQGDAKREGPLKFETSEDATHGVLSFIERRGKIGHFLHGDDDRGNLDEVWSSDFLVQEPRGPGVFDV